jgi:hypothetical protein
MTDAVPLDSFGALISNSLRDAALRRAEALLSSSLKSPSTQALQSHLQGLTQEQREIVRAVVRNCIDCGVHDFLFKLQELSRAAESVSVLVDGQDVASLSDGLQGEPFSERGWFARFSKFPTA